MLDSTKVAREFVKILDVPGFKFYGIGVSNEILFGFKDEIRTVDVTLDSGVVYGLIKAKENFDNGKMTKDEFETFKATVRLKIGI